MAPPFSLLALPDELLLCVLSHLSNERRFLSAVASACRKLQDLAEPFIYESILVVNGSQLPRLSYALTARKERVRFINSLDLRCRYTLTAGMSSIDTLLPVLVNLKELTIESPWCNHSAISPDAWDDEVRSYTRTFRDASLLASLYDGGPAQPLARLQSCTLHWSGAQTRRWPLSKAAILFLHPTLRELTISCADAAKSFIDIPFEKYRSSTRLQQLTLIECNISDATVESLLSLPSALQSLEITSSRSRLNKEVSLGGLIRTLVAHQPKIESLAFANKLDSWYGYDTPSDDFKMDLSSLRKLKYLALPYDNGARSRFFENVNVSPNQVFASLETVSFGIELRKDIANSVLSYHRKLGFRPSQCPRLRTLVIALGNLQVMAEEDEGSESENISFVDTFKKRLLEDFKGSKIRIILQKTIRHRYVPPYLFREQAPERMTIFDSGAEEVTASSSM